MPMCHVAPVDSVVFEMFREPLKAMMFNIVLESVKSMFLADYYYFDKW